MSGRRPSIPSTGPFGPVGGLPPGTARRATSRSGPQNVSVACEACILSDPALADVQWRPHDRAGELVACLGHVAGLTPGHGVAGRKWLFGPRGTGIVWGRPEAWARVSPTFPSFTDPPSFGAWLEGGLPEASSAAAFTPGGFHAFEHRWALAQAFAFQRTIGKRRVRERTHTLARRLKAGLADLPGIVVHTPTAEALSAGLVCFEVGSRPPEEIVERLRREHGIVGSVTPYASRYVRFGTSIVNSEDEVDAALAALRELA